MNFRPAPATVALGSLAGVELLGGREVHGALELGPFGVAVIRAGRPRRDAP